MSNIKVSVKWECPTVFAGEEVRCTITFKNVATTPERSRSTSPNSQARGLGASRERWNTNPPKSSLRKVLRPSVSEPQGRGHQPAPSLNSTNGNSRNVSPVLPENASEKSRATGHKHQRSVSIVSLGSSNNNTGDEHQRRLSAPQRQNPRGSHVRAASYQGMPRRLNTSLQAPHRPFAETKSFPGSLLNHTGASPSQMSRSSSAQQQTTTSFLPADEASPPPSRNSFLQLRAAKHARGPSGLAPLSSKTPRGPSATSTANGHVTSVGGVLDKSEEYENIEALETSKPMPRVISPVSVVGTPRSSVDFYSMSNNSAETLASEYVVPGHSRQVSGVGYDRKSSHLSPVIATNRPPETLMMGYVQLMGSFTLDGSLVNLTPFDTVKRKGIIGGQGSGGVVGLETPKRSSGLFGALGWGNIGESLGGFLGGSELSSIREMKGIANAKSVPILSTSQAILFVDLRLNPGESKSYSYSHALPRGIPPSHRGRAMKVSYQLVIGTQRSQSAVQQHLVRHVDIPFRVLPSVNSEGETLGHDLMSPHVILKNNAKSRSIADGLGLNLQVLHIADKNENSQRPGNNDAQGFLQYVENILQKPRQSSGIGFLSPNDQMTSMTPAHSQFDTDMDVSMKDVIDLAIQRSNATAPTKRSSNRFQIQRAGDRVAAISLSRSAYRLGETVSAIIDFRGADIACYSLHVTLETSEIVDPAIALRSESSIYRATRRIHGSWSEHTICTDRAVFDCMIPSTATPEFLTSGVQLEWKLRVEFVTGTKAVGDDEENIELMEEIVDDERGKVFAAAQQLPCESFDVSVPIRVYGATGGADEQYEVNDLSI